MPRPQQPCLPRLHECLDAMTKASERVQLDVEGDRAPARGAELFPVVEDDRWGDEISLTPMLDAVAVALGTFSEAKIPAGASATIVFSNDAQVRMLNAQFRKIDKATNVLSFPAGGGSVSDSGQPYLGDVVLAYETVDREASEQGIEGRHHLIHLIVHGLLHLTGHDHAGDNDAEIMEALETRVLAHIGIADPYAD